MIGAFALLLVCQLAGEIFSRTLSLPVPGPVIGLALLAAGLWIDAVRKGSAPEAIEETQLGQVSHGLLANLGLMFVPAGVGIVQQLDVFSDYGLAIGIALVASTVLTLLVTVGAFLLAKRVLS